MSLFDSIDDDATVDDVEKSRLFDTLKDEGRSAHDYLKILIPVVVAVLVIGGAVVYFTMPGVGDEVRAPSGLDEAVKNHFLDNEKRAVSEATYYYCGDFYSARATLEKRPDITARHFDHGNRRAVAVENPNGTWQITSAPLNPNESVEPCTR
jgi:hypothetical protein